MVSDIVAEGLDVLFVGYNPSLKSDQLGHHFAGPGNLFWSLLADAALTSHRLAFDVDRDLLRYQIGIVNLVDRPTAGSADLDPAECRQGAIRLRSRVQGLKPHVVAFLGKEIFRHYRGMARSAPCSWGAQPHALVEGVQEWVVPNPSRRSTLSYSVRLGYFRALAQAVGGSSALP